MLNGSTKWFRDVGIIYIWILLHQPIWLLFSLRHKCVQFVLMEIYLVAQREPIWFGDTVGSKDENPSLDVPPSPSV